MKKNLWTFKSFIPSIIGVSLGFLYFLFAQDLTDTFDISKALMPVAIGVVIGLLIRFMR